MAMHCSPLGLSSGSWQLPLKKNHLGSSPEHHADCSQYKLRDVIADPELTIIIGTKAIQSATCHVTEVLSMGSREGRVAWMMITKGN